MGLRRQPSTTSRALVSQYLQTACKCHAHAWIGCVACNTQTERDVQALEACGCPREAPPVPILGEELGHFTKENAPGQWVKLFGSGSPSISAGAPSGNAPCQYTFFLSRGTIITPSEVVLQFVRSFNVSYCGCCQRVSAVLLMST